MLGQDRAVLGALNLETAIAKAQEYLLSLQTDQGYWWAELESNVTITSEVVLLHKNLGHRQNSQPR